MGADRGSDRALTDHATSFSMRPIPVAFHVWFLEVHTYGIGLALTFWFGLRYTERRLRRAGYPWQWVTGMFVWVIIAAIVGARALHVLSNLSYYSNHPSQIIAIWQGGLSSFGGLLFAVPVAIVSSRRRCPELPSLRFADLMAPVLMACWGIGRLLGPQLMVAGGGHPTNQWFGMYYAGQVGQAASGADLPVHRGLDHLRHPPAGRAVAAHRGPGTRPWSMGAGDPPPVLLPPAGIVLGVGMVLWGIERFLDEHLWLGEDGHLGLAAGPVGGHRPGRHRDRAPGHPDRSAPARGAAARAVTRRRTGGAIPTGRGPEHRGRATGPERAPRPDAGTDARTRRSDPASGPRAPTETPRDPGRGPRRGRAAGPSGPGPLHPPSAPADASEPSP